MKKIITTFLLAIVLAACTSSPEGFVLSGELRGEIEDGTQVFLKTTDSARRAMIELDTTIVQNGTFSFSGAADIPQLNYIFIDGIRGNAPVIVENGTISFKAQKDSLSFVALKGTLQNDLFMTYLEESRTLSAMSRSMNEEFRRANAPGNRDSAVIQSLREEYLELQERGNTFEKDFVEEHPNALISALILEKILANKTLPVSEVSALYESLTPEIKESRPGKRLAELLEAAKATSVGAKAPEFSGPTPQGDQLALSDVKGKLTLIDFWAAWCKPCRMENPNIVSVYNKYKDKGLEVVGVSLDRKKEDWLGAIESDGLAWNHISHLQYFQGPIAQLYNVNAIPAAFLLDENGVIIAKDLRGAALESKVAELLN